MNQNYDERQLMDDHQINMYSMNRNRILQQDYGEEQYEDEQYDDEQYSHSRQDENDMYNQYDNQYDNYQNQQQDDGDWDQNKEDMQFDQKLEEYENRSQDSCNKSNWDNFVNQFIHQLHKMKNIKMIKKKYQNLQQQERKIVSGVSNYNYRNNMINTTFYDKYNIIPRIFYSQFQKKYNFYFLTIGLLQCVPFISTSNGIPFILFPLFIIIFLTTIKEYLEDLKKKQIDKQENQQKTFLYKNGKFIQTQWQYIHVGDIIKIQQNKQSPADVLLIYSSNPSQKVFVETKNLDGESSLKEKKVDNKIQIIFQSDLFYNNQILLICEKPNYYLTETYGVIHSFFYKKFIVKNENMILRNCRIRNTSYAIGLVAYAGHDTKIMQNQIKKQKKKSSLNFYLEKMINCLIFIQILICVVISILHTVSIMNQDEYIKKYMISKYNINLKYQFGIKFFNWILIFSNIIPISLFMSLEITKFIQVQILVNNRTLKKQKQNIIVNNSNISEDLGQVKHVFSDKTGTLTSNILLFKCITVGKDNYGIYPTNVNDKNYIEDIELNQIKEMIECNYKVQITNVDFRDRQLFDVLENKQDARHKQLVHILFILALCHQGNVNFRNQKYNLNIQSEDEKALINFALFAGVQFLGFDEHNRQLIRYDGQCYKFKLLYNLEFTSQRNKQSVIVKDESDRIYLYCKGADNVLEKIINKEDSRYFMNIMEYNQHYGVQGLRTLLICQRRLNPNVFYKWQMKYEAALKLQDNKNQELEWLQSAIEQDLILVGTTAIEDELQPDVQLTIESLKAAGIKVWVLTGDKIETAINIAYQCGLLNGSIQRFVIEDQDHNKLMEQLENIMDILFHQQCYEQNNQKKKYALIINGDALVRMNTRHFSDKIFQIINYCEVVLSCRVSPKQKQELVMYMIDKNPKITTLAIGDGANDVNMINTAHIGIGIRGSEGFQASKNSDISIQEFRILRYLLFVHGREYCRKNCQLVFFIFYKNLVLVMNTFWLGFYTHFDGVIIYDDYLYQTYDMFFNTLPIIIYAVWDKEYSEDYLLQNKFQSYQNNFKYNKMQRTFFINWTLYAIYESAVIMYFNIFIYQNVYSNSEGYQFFFKDLGVIIVLNMILTTNLMVLLMCTTLYVINIIVFILQLGTFFLNFYIINYNFSSSGYGVMNKMTNSPILMFSNIIVICMTVSLSYIFKQITMITVYYFREAGNKYTNSTNKGIQYYIWRILVFFRVLSSSIPSNKNLNKYQEFTDYYNVEMKAEENNKLGLISKYDI